MRTPRASRLLALAGAGLALGVAASPSLAATDSADTAVSATVNKYVSISAPSSVDFGAVDVNSVNVATPAGVTVVSNDPGYTLSASRTLFRATGDDLGLALKPAGADASEYVSIPTTGSALLVTGSAITPEAGTTYDFDWRLSVPFVQFGSAQSTVTFTVATP